MSALLRAASLPTAKHDWSGALRALLEVWRETPATPIATAIEAISARASAGMTAPTAPTAKGRNDAWNALAKRGDPVAMGMLCATVAATRGNGDTLARLELLLAHGPDPRLSAVVCNWIERPIYNVTVTRTQKFWKRIWPLLAEMGDPRILERARGFVAKWETNPELNAPERPMLAQQLDKVMDALQTAYAAHPVLSPEDAAVCAAIAAAGGATPVLPDRTEDELLAAIYAAPDDDAPRLVYADWLQERGNARGELIVLQIARARGKLTKEQTAREKALLAEHAATWIAPLPIHRTGVKFERGFVAEGTSSGPFGEEPAWSTVRRTNVVPISDAARTASLRILDVVPSTLTRLAALTRPLAVEQLEWTRLSLEYDADAIFAFQKITVLPHLRRLSLEPWGDWLRTATAERLAWLIEAPCTQALEELRLLLAPAAITGLIAAFAKRPLRRLATFNMDDARRPGWETTIERDAAGQLAKLTIRVHHVPPSEMLASTWGIDVLDWLTAAPPTLFSDATIEIPKPSARAFSRLRPQFVAALGRQQRIAKVRFA